ncbi:MAG: hypothetical protein R3C49_07720 [Planctomycetaceae bacterium]
MAEWFWTSTMKRVLCLRFLNWPIQRLQRSLPADSTDRIAVHSPLPDTGGAHTRNNAPTGNVSASRSESLQTQPADSAASGSDPGRSRPARGGRRRTKSRRISQQNAVRDLAFVRELFPVARSGTAIISASDAAWAAGIRPGLPLTEARSMASSVSGKPARRRQAAAAETIFTEWQPADDRDELLLMAELVRRFAPIIGMDDGPVPDSLLLDITGCGPLFGGELPLAEQLLKTLQQHRLHCRAAISDTVAAAWAFAHADGHFLQRTGPSQTRRSTSTSTEWDLPVVLIPPGQAEAWLHPLPLSAGRIPLQDSLLLNQLGISNLKQLLALPSDDLPSRLSEAAIRNLNLLRGTTEEIITAIPEAHPVKAVWTSEYPAGGIEEIRQVTAFLMPQIADQLQRRRVGAIRVRCQLKTEQGSVQKISAELLKPTQTEKELLDVLALKLETLLLPEPVASVTLLATVMPLPIARQRDLFNTDEHIRPAEELAMVLNRLSSRLGKQAVLLAEFSDSQLPEQRLQLSPVMHDQHQGSSDETERRLDLLVATDDCPDTAASDFNVPLRLLNIPEKLTLPQTDVPAGRLAWRETSSEISAVIGPQRMQTNWWDDTSVARDYFRVRTEAGSEFWIFRNLNDGLWYLHGTFE